MLLNKGYDNMNKRKVYSPSSWKFPENHLHKLLQDEWYAIINVLFSGIFIATHDFYRKKSIQPSLFPITTGSISSPMGLGSDSLPVKVKIRNNEVYLADSMQFCLEIGARLNEKGSYYIMPTFRGENIDSRHLNEFIHSEAEIKGNIKDVMKLFFISGQFVPSILRYKGFSNSSVINLLYFSIFLGVFISPRLLNLSRYF